MTWRSCTAVLGLLLGVSQPALAVEHYGYALVDPASGEVAGYNSRGGRIEVTRYDREAGVSVVTFRRLADPRFGGHVQVTAAGFNEGLAYCKIRSWDSSGADVQITVACYDMVSRLPMQQRHKYSVLYLADHEPITAEAGGKGAQLLTNLPAPLRVGSAMTERGPWIVAMRVRDYERAGLAERDGEGTVRVRFLPLRYDPSLGARPDSTFLVINTSGTWTRPHIDRRPCTVAGVRALP